MNKVEAIQRALIYIDDLRELQFRLQRLHGHLPHAFEQQLSKAETHLQLASEHLTVDANLETLLDTSIEELERRHHDR